MKSFIVVMGILVVGGVLLYSTITNNKTEFYFEMMKLFKITFKSEKNKRAKK